LPKDSGKDKSGMSCINVSLSLDQDIDQTSAGHEDSATASKMAKLTIIVHVRKYYLPIIF